MTQTQLKVVWHVAALAFLTINTTQLASAQIIDEIGVTVSHPFIVGNTTLPPGKYDFRMLSTLDLSVMTVTSVDGNTATEFQVRESEANPVPQHTELVFNRYGKRRSSTATPIWLPFS